MEPCQKPVLCLSLHQQQSHLTSLRIIYAICDPALKENNCAAVFKQFVSLMFRAMYHVQLK